MHCTQPHQAMAVALPDRQVLLGLQVLPVMTVPLVPQALPATQAKPALQVPLVLPVPQAMMAHPVRLALQVQPALPAIQAKLAQQAQQVPKVILAPRDH